MVCTVGPLNATLHHQFKLVSVTCNQKIQMNTVPMELATKEEKIFDVVSWWKSFVQITQLAKQKTFCAHRRIVWMKRSSLEPLEWEH